MPITIGANIASLGVQRKLAKGSDALSRVYERLSSGQRINRASDDAAGLAMSQSLITDTRVYSQAFRNVSDAISAVSIATEALNALSAIVVRQQELATQAANGTYTFNQRQALNTEANALVDEFNRIAASTEFNGMSLLGTSMNVQAGYGSAATITVDMGSAALRTHGDGTFNPTYQVLSTGSSTTQGLDIADINGDGVNDIVTSNWTDGTISILLGNSDGSFAATTTLALPGAGSELVLADMNNDGRTDIITRSSSFGLQISVFLGNGDGSFLASKDSSSTPFFEFALGDFNNDGNLDFIGGHPSFTGIGINLGNGDGSFAAPVTLDAASTGVNFFATDLNQDGNLDYVGSIGGSFRSFLGNGDGTFTQVASMAGIGSGFDISDTNADGYADLVNVVGTNTMVRLGNGDGTFQGPATYASSVTATRIFSGDINGDGNLDLISYASDITSTKIYTRLGNGDGTFQGVTSYAAPDNIGPYQIGVKDLTGDGVADLSFVQQTGQPGVSIFTANTTTELTQGALNLLTQVGAQSALTELSATFNRIAAGLGSLNAATSRLEVAANNLSAAREVYAQAASRITDIDVAQEVAEMVRLSILQQTSTALLAQINLQPSVVLELLKFE